MTEWREFKIKDIADVVGGGTPSTAINEYWNGDIPWLTPKDLTGYIRNFISHGERFITKKGLENSSARLLPKGTVLLTSRAPIGYVAIAENEICTNQGFKSLVPNPDKAHNLFLLYWIKSNVEYLQSIGTGTTFQEISGSVLKDVDIILPPLPEQKAIAEVLSSLDDKIDLLTRQNKTLEDLAQAYFRKWFIEDASDKWEEIPLGQLFVISSGKGLKKEKFTEHGQYRVLGANGEIGKTNEYLFNERLIYTGRVGTLGNVFIVDREPVWLSDNTLVFRNIKYFFFVYFSLKWENLADYNVGSTQPLIRQSDIKEIRVFMPDKERLDSFENLANSIFAKINSNQKQIQLLQKLRDTLLPKLISGEIRIKM